MIKNYKIEACVETYEEAIKAQENGANQIELCGRLDLDGITPDRSLIEKCMDTLTIDIKVMIRPRGGSFKYSGQEIIQMEADINYCKQLGVHGVVFGVLVGDILDIDKINKLAIISQPLKVTVHKAIDATADILGETKRLTAISAHIDTILTSGGADTAESGIDNLRKMMEICDSRINIMPAGKVTNANLLSLHKELQTTGYHGRKIVGDLSESSN